VIATGEVSAVTESTGPSDEDQTEGGRSEEVSAEGPGSTSDAREAGKAVAAEGERDALEGSPGGDGIPRRSPEGRFFPPLVRSIAEEGGVTVEELESIEGSGSEGRVTKEDVMAYLEERGESSARTEAREEAPVPPQQLVGGGAEVEGEDGDYGDRVEVVPMDRMRQVIAEHMVHSKRTSAHVTSFAEADVTNLVRLRENNKEAFYEREGLEATDEEVDERVGEIAEAEGMEPGQVRRQLAREDQMESLRRQVAAEKVFDVLKEQSSIE
jgi:2-oxoglutarate dehydrogenase E2 component (dihydrolipoamide succinyltransferase)